MKFIYPAVFRKTENGTYHGFFPDLECCYADGDTDVYKRQLYDCSYHGNQ